MKHSIKYISIFALAIFSLVIVSCDKDNPISEDYDLTYSIATPTELVEVEVVDGTIDQDPMLNMVSANGDIEDRVKKQGKCRPKIGKNIVRFDGQFRPLKLSDEQKTSVRALVQSHRECMKSARHAFIEANEEALTTAINARKEVIAQYKAGTITQDEAKASIKAINDNLRSTIASNGTKEEAKNAMISCFNTLDAGIELVLTAEQLEKWIELKSRRPDKI